MALAIAIGCSAPQLAQPADVALSLVDIDCQSCGATALTVLRAQPGVAKAEFDLKSAEIRVHFDAARILPGDMVRLIAAAKLKAKVGGGQGSYAPQQEFPAGADVQWVTKTGEAVDIAKAAVPGKVTVVDFGAPWCMPCRALDKDLAEQLKARPLLALRKVDIVDWDTPAAKTNLANVPALPYTVVFNARGGQVGSVAGLDLPKFHQLLDQASQP